MRKALYEAGFTEANLTNPKVATDHDSLGALQQRPSMGWGSPHQVTNPRYAARKFLEKAMAANKGFKGTAGELAQSVQRSAFPDRYDQHGKDAMRVIRKFGDGGGSSSRTPSSHAGVNDPAPTDRHAALQEYLSRSHDSDSLLTLAQRLKSAVSSNDTRAPELAKSNVAGGGVVGKIKARAERVDDAHPSYLWGGGHGAKPEKLGRPVDCSGAVSQVLGVNPRVSGEFEKWGKPGRGRVTVYASGKHVFMEIDGHFWGTSASNPGGGAGWIPREKMSKEYLKGFTVRHLPGAGR